MDFFNTEKTEDSENTEGISDKITFTHYFSSLKTKYFLFALKEYCILKVLNIFLIAIERKGSSWKI